MASITDKAKQLAHSAQAELIGTLKNMSPAAVEGRYQAMDSARQARDAQMIRDNFGSEANYAKVSGMDTPEGRAQNDKLFTPWYTKLARALESAYGSITK